MSPASMSAWASPTRRGVGLSPGPLADEPTGSLDPENRDGVLALWRGMNAAGKTIVVATHDELVARSCSRQVSLGAGGPADAHGGPH